MDNSYAAGIFDGEGCVQVKPGQAGRSKSPFGHLNLGANVVNTHIGVLRWFHARYGGGIYTKPWNETVKRTAAFWVVSGRAAGKFLSSIVGYTIIKRPQIEAAIMFAETLYDDWRILGVSGKPLSAEGSELRRLTYRAFREAMYATGSSRVPLA